MSRRRRRRPDDQDEALDVIESPADLRRDKQRRRRKRTRGRLLVLLIPSLAINTLAVYALKTSSSKPAPKTKVVELDVIEPEPPALPPKTDRATTPKKATARRDHLRPRPHKRRHKPRIKPRVARKARVPERAVARRPTPKTPPEPPPRARKAPSFQPFRPGLLRMRAAQPVAPTPPTRSRTRPTPPSSKVDELRVAGHRVRRRTYADGGRLLSNVDGARVRAPERASFWRTRAAPKNDVARLSLAGIASMIGGRRGVICNHLKRFPPLAVDGQRGRTIHLLIDSSPSMEGSMSSAEVCAVGIANSALQKGYAVALGRFGMSTVCHPQTKNSNLIRDHILSRQRIGGTLLPTTCGADKAKTAVDVVIVSDGGFFRASAGKLTEANRVLRKPGNRGALYLVPDARFMINAKVVGALRSIGFKVIRFGARRAGAKTRTARVASPRSLL